MKNRYGVLAALAAASLSGLALAGPTLGTWFNTSAVSAGQKVPAWGAAKGNGWAQLPGNIIAVSQGGGTSNPICMVGSFSTSNAQEKRGWVGVATSQTYSNGDVVVNCRAAHGSNELPGTIFIQKPNAPAPAWASSDSTKPEPRGAVLIATQENPARRLYACSFTAGAARYVGYIGDDGVCYATSASSGTRSQDVYDVLVKSSAPADAVPNAGWASAVAGYLPHGTLAKVTEPVGPLRNGVVEVRNEPKLWTVCRVKESNQWWPGYIQPDRSCGYLTYFGGSTQRKNSNSYEVFRMGAGPLVTDYVFNRMNGAKYYACTAFLNGTGPVVGFSSNLTGCTDGLTTGSSQLKRLNLPNVDHDRG